MGVLVTFGVPHGPHCDKRTNTHGYTPAHTKQEKSKSVSRTVEQHSPKLEMRDSSDLCLENGFVSFNYFEKISSLISTTDGWQDRITVISTVSTVINSNDLSLSFVSDHVRCMHRKREKKKPRDFPLPPISPVFFLHFLHCNHHALSSKMC